MRLIIPRRHSAAGTIGTRNHKHEEVQGVGGYCRAHRANHRYLESASKYGSGRVAYLSCAPK